MSADPLRLSMAPPFSNGAERLLRCGLRDSSPVRRAVATTREVTEPANGFGKWVDELHEQAR